ncbi:MAG: response regulator transcription factor [Eubacteriales bacterium]
MIYIVEDDINIRQMESYALKNSGYTVLEFGDAKSFFAECKNQLPSLVILDIMLPGEDGFDILKKLRYDALTKNIPVIIVTAKVNELNIVKGLDYGADDYITKPFGIMELISRVKAILRRTNMETQMLYKFGNVTLDDEKHLVTADNTVCDLTFKEYELLKYLLANPCIVLSRNKLMDKVWGTEFEGESRTVDMHIKTLRQKLGKCGEIIKTVRNVGYKIE